MKLNKNSWALGFCMMVLVGSFATTAKAGGACSGTNVTSNISDTDITTYPLTPIPYQLQSDTKGAYTSFKTGKDQVCSVIQGSGNWGLDTASSTSRGMKLKFIPVSGSSVPSFGSQYSGAAGINNGCSAPGFGGMTAAGQKTTCTMQFSFTINGTTYILALNPTNFLGSSLMQVTCTGANSSGCNQWAVIPDPNTGTLDGTTGQFSAVGALHVAGNTAQALGYYYVDFNFLLTKP